MTTERIVIKGKTIFRLCLALALVSASASGAVFEGCERDDRVCINAREAAAQKDLKGNPHAIHDERDMTVGYENQKKTCGAWERGEAKPGDDVSKCKMSVEDDHFYKAAKNPE